MGAALAMDAFSVSLANGLADREMKTSKVMTVACTFAFFQFLMPMLGWVLVHTAVKYLEWLDNLIPWIALILLSLIGIKMIRDGLAERKCIEGENPDAAAGEKLGAVALIVQGIATSIDALSVGFTTASYGIGEALFSSGIIGIVTFVICAVGVMLGRKAAGVLSWKATIAGGLILIAIGIRIFLS